MTDELHQRLAQAEAIALTLHARLEQAEEDATVLRNALLMLIRHGAGNVLSPDDFDHVQAALSVNAGAALLAELEAARKVVSIAREEWATSADLMNAIADYNEALKANRS